MLTVKVHSVPDDGLGVRDESIYSAVSVHCSAVRGNQAPAKIEGFQLLINLPDKKEQVVCIDDDTAVFVENSAGKTVQVYRSYQPDT